MTCDEIKRISALYLSGELNMSATASVESHLAECKACSSTVQADRDLDTALRSALLSEAVDTTRVAERVRHHIYKPSWRQRLFPLPGYRLATLAAVVLIAIVVGFRVDQDNRSRDVTVAKAAAQDHYEDLVKGRERQWAQTPEQIAEFVAEEFPGKVDVIGALEPQGTHILKVRLCNLGGTHFAHFVFSSGTDFVSVFARADQGRAPADVSDHLGFQVAGFSASGYAGAVVSKLGVEQTRQFADHAARSL